MVEDIVVGARVVRAGIEVVGVAVVDEEGASVIGAGVVGDAIFVAGAAGGCLRGSRCGGGLC